MSAPKHGPDAAARVRSSVVPGWEEGVGMIPAGASSSSEEACTRPMCWLNDCTVRAVAVRVFAMATKRLSAT